MEPAAQQYVEMAQPRAAGTTAGRDHGTTAVGATPAAWETRR
jgi:hypothetical protein